MSNMSAIISPYGDVQKTIDELNKDTPIVKFAYEFCREFGVQVNAIVSGNIVSSSRLRVLSLDGIQLGFIYTEMHRNSSGATEPVYFFESPNIIKKAKSTARANSNTRDSNKIKTLITNLKKNREIPEVKSMHEALKHGIRYAFTNVSNGRAPSISIADELAIVLIEHVLLDKSVSHEQNEALSLAYKSYQSEMKKFESSNENAKRFENGARIIGITNGDKPYYLVGEATYHDKQVEIHGGLKRYNSLKDVPEFTADVLMINTYMQSQSQNDMRNELGLPRRDTYYPDIDVSTGYSGDELWVALPKTAP
jgi:hypothetical protein